MGHRVDYLDQPLGAGDPVVIDFDRYLAVRDLQIVVVTSPFAISRSSLQAPRTAINGSIANSFLVFMME